MSRMTRAPQAPVVVQGQTAPIARGRRPAVAPRPAAAPAAQEHAQYGGGGLGSLTPMATAPEEGPEGVINVSANQAFNAGGDPQYTALDEQPAVEAPPVPRYRVLKEKQVALQGHRFTLKQGKEIDASNYNIELLKRYGVELERITP